MWLRSLDHQPFGVMFDKGIACVGVSVLIEAVALIM